MKPKGLIPFLNSIAGQLVLLLIVVTGLSLASMYVSFSILRQAPEAPPIRLFVERQVAVAEVIAMLPAKDRSSYVEQLGKTYPYVRYVLLSAGFELSGDLEWRKGDAGPRRPPEGPPPILGVRLPRFGEHKAEAATGETPLRQAGGPPRNGHFGPLESPLVCARSTQAQGERDLRVSVYCRMPDSTVLQVSRDIPNFAPPNFLIENFLTFVTVGITILLMWAMIFLVRPIRRLARVTDRIGKENAEPQPVEISGPTEVRLAARALNKMQDRIHHLIDDRTRMLAAVGHDLRTPVTRLRLRVDTLNAGDAKTAFLRDIDMMDGLLTRLMTYFKKGETGEETVTLELSSLVDSLASEWSDAGHDVAIMEGVTARIKARPNELKRMLDNLIDNAVKYAGSCTLSLQRDEESAYLQVIDHGPGIPESDKLLLLEPFARGDKARTMNDKSGFGLGLAIANQVVENHGAYMDLEDTEGGGLTIKLRFPLARPN